MPEEINAFTWSADIDLLILSIYLILGFIMGLILRFNFKKYGSVLSNRDELGQILPLITLTIILIISIVKSSLALSLGLVGALSIVRFRTPIKEPEELAYLFLAIAVGLGLGAGQVIPTVTSFFIIMAAITITKKQSMLSNTKNMHLLLTWQIAKSKTKNKILKEMNAVLSLYTDKKNLRRCSLQNDFFETDYVVDLKTENDLDLLIDDLKKNFRGINITFLDSNNMAKL